MKVVFKKRRYHRGRYREVGEIMDMDAKHYRAFSRVNAVAPVVKQASAKKQPMSGKGPINQLKSQAGDSEINAKNLEELKELKLEHPADFTEKNNASQPMRRRRKSNGDDIESEGD